MNKEILNKIQELFFSKLESKTGWGKNNVKELYNQCVIEVLSEYIEDKLPQDDYNYNPDGDDNAIN
jgi:hypothetical protein